MAPATWSSPSSVTDRRRPSGETRTIGELRRSCRRATPRVAGSRTCSRAGGRRGAPPWRRPCAWPDRRGGPRPTRRRGRCERPSRATTSVRRTRRRRRTGRPRRDDPGRRECLGNLEDGDPDTRSAKPRFIERAQVDLETPGAGTEHRGLHADLDGAAACVDEGELERPVVGRGVGAEGPRYRVEPLQPTGVDRDRIHRRGRSEHRGPRERRRQDRAQRRGDPGRRRGDGGVA